jgi:O-antigen/teichoic acid export membrane protein
VGLVKSYHQGAQLVSVVAGSAAVILILNAEVLLRLWTQDSALAERTAPLLRLLVVGNLLNSFMWMPYQCQLAYGWTGLGVRVNIVSVVFIVPAIFWATERYGSLGAAWVWVGLNAGYCLIGIHFMYRRILQKETWSWYRGDILEPIIAAAMAALFIGWLLPSPESIIGQLGVLACSSVVVIMASGLAAKELRNVFVNSYKRLI